MDTLGRAELAAGDHQRALSTFKKLASLQPRNAVPEMRLAETYAAMKDSESAARSLRRAAELQPGNVAITRAQARLAVADGRLDDAVKLAREMQKRFPKDATGYTAEGEIEVGRKNWDAAIAAYRASLKLAPSTETTAKLHTALVAANKPADAERLAADWIKTNPKDASFHYFLGDVALARNDLPRAEARYRAVLDLQPDNALAMNNVAWLLLKQGKPGALALSQKANQLLPDRAPLIDTLSMALEGENKLPEAIEAQKRAITLEAKDPSLALRLAKLYIKAGDKTRARGELDALSKLGDKFAGQREVAELLGTL
jgi:cellulose synthase operon protein C